MRSYFVEIFDSQFLSVLSVFTGSRIVRRHHIELSDPPVLNHAVTCNNNAVLVATGGDLLTGDVPGAVVIFSWSGEQLQRLTAQQLGIQQDHFIRAAVYNDRKQTLQLAAGRYNLTVLYSCLVSHITHPTSLTTHSHNPHSSATSCRVFISADYPLTSPKFHGCRLSLLLSYVLSLSLLLLSLLLIVSVLRSCVEL